MTGPDAKLILARDSVDGVPCCTRCGEQLGPIRGWDYSIHHRRRRDGKPDTHSPQNCVAVCGASNYDGCHGWTHSCRSESQPAGFWLSRVAGDNPLLIPILLRGERWVYLTADGGYSDNPPTGDTNG